MTKKLAIVTGAGSGVGKGVALYLAKQDYYVVLIARSERKLKDVYEGITQNGGTAEMCQLDISDAKNVSTTIKKIIENHGQIDFLFNNAGILRHGTTDILDQDLDELLKTNLNGAIYVAKNVAAQMKKQKNGYIMNVSSERGKIAASFDGAYCASKFGLSGYSEALTKEMSLYGVKVTNICPSMTATDMVTKDRSFPPEEMIQVSDIIKTVDYLLSLSNSALPTEIVIYSLPFIEKTTNAIKQLYGFKSYD
jgi:short-subunit dehydrogenase